MAILTAVRVSSAYLDQPLPEPGFHIEVWRVPAGGLNGDTATISPARGRFIVSVKGGPASHNLSAAGTNSNVTLTVVAGAGAIGAFDVELMIQE